jgi:hypothetical protein
MRPSADERRADSATDLDRLSSEVPPSRTRLGVRQQMHGVREAFRLRRQARAQCLAHGFYLEHSLFGEAANARRKMLELLRGARVHWRRTLGLPISVPSGADRTPGGRG